MASNNSKYSEEMRNETARFIIESGKSATSVAEEMGIDKNTVCRWVRDYRREHNMPTYTEEKGINRQTPKVDMDLKRRNKELEKELREKDREIERQKRLVEEEREKVNILKQSLHIFMQPQG